MKFINIVRIIGRKSVRDIEAARESSSWIKEQYPKALSSYLDTIAENFVLLNSTNGVAPFPKPDLTKYIEEHYDKGLLLIFTANLLRLPEFFNSNANRMYSLMCVSFAHAIGLSRKELEEEIISYKRIMINIGYGSKNIVSITAQGLFHILNLYPFQEEYYFTQRTPSPPLLKKLIPITSSFFFPWNEYLQHKSIKFQ